MNIKYDKDDMNCKGVKAVPKDNVAKDCPNKGVTQM